MGGGGVGAGWGWGDWNSGWGGMGVGMGGHEEEEAALGETAFPSHQSWKCLPKGIIGNTQGPGCGWDSLEPPPWGGLRRAPSSPDAALPERTPRPCRGRASSSREASRVAPWWERWAPVLLSRRPLVGGKTAHRLTLRCPGPAYPVPPKPSTLVPTAGRGCASPQEPQRPRLAAAPREPSGKQRGPAVNRKQWPPGSLAPLRRHVPSPRTGLDSLPTTSSSSPGLLR